MARSTIVAAEMRSAPAKKREQLLSQLIDSRRDFRYDCVMAARDLADLAT